MAEIRKDPISDRWVIIQTDNPMRPDDFELDQEPASSGICPFCPGHEELTPPEITRAGSSGSGWTIRVVPNKFPALLGDEPLASKEAGPYSMLSGFGGHEVIIETPDHTQELQNLSDDQIRSLFRMYQSRAQLLQKDRRFRYILIFKNFGESAGASLAHPHSQLIALPIVPKRAREELAATQAFHQQFKRCAFCDMIKQERDLKQRVVAESGNFICLAPFVSRSPFELWLLPKEHHHDFNSAEPDQLDEIAVLLKQVLGKLTGILKSPPYNFLIHSSPLDADGNQEYYHWHLELMPRLTRVAGFEWGSGFYINPTPPELAAELLRSSSK